MDRRLHQFLAVAEMGNLSQAAEALGVSQPTISVNIRKLEEEHQVALFERSSRGVVLTDYGAVLFDHVRTMARLADSARAEIQALRSNKEHGLRIGCGFAWWPFPLRQVVAGFRADNPDLSVLVDVSNSLDGLRKLLAGDITMFIGTEVNNLKSNLGIRFAPLFSAPHAFFAREDHPLAGRPCARRDVEDFEKLDVVPIEPSHLGIVLPGGSSGGALTPNTRRATLSSNSMTVCLDLLHASDATLGYPRSLEDFFAAHGIFPLDVREGDFPELIGIYHLDIASHAARLDDLQSRIADVLSTSE